MMETPYQIYSQLRECKKIVANALEDKDFESVLEVGCQWGENLVAIREKYPDKKIVGVDIDKPVLLEAQKLTGLDLRVGNLLDLQFDDKEFDVVFAEALFCMITPSQVESGLDEMLRVAKKHIILVELAISALTGYAPGGRTAANWIEIFKRRGIKVEVGKIPASIWDVNPWLEHGYVYYAKVGN